MLEDKNRIKLVQALQLISVQYSIALTELNKTCSSLFDTSATQKLIVAEDQAASNKQTARRLTQKLGAIDWGEDGPGDGPLLLERGNSPHAHTHTHTHMQNRCNIGGTLSFIVVIESGLMNCRHVLDRYVKPFKCDRYESRALLHSNGGTR